MMKYSSCKSKRGDEQKSPDLSVRVSSLLKYIIIIFKKKLKLKVELKQSYKEFINVQV
ncbi:MAG: hypothetical protein RXO33_00200 [Nitrososphaeria archaeon]